MLALPKTARSAQTHKSISFILIVWSTLYVYLCPWYQLLLRRVTSGSCQVPRKQKGITYLIFKQSDMSLLNRWTVVNIFCNLLSSLRISFEILYGISGKKIIDKSYPWVIYSLALRQLRNYISQNPSLKFTSIFPSIIHPIRISNSIMLGFMILAWWQNHITNVVVPIFIWTWLKKTKINNEF